MKDLELHHLGSKTALKRSPIKLSIKDPIKEGSVVTRTGHEVIKLFFMLSSAETKIYTAHK